MDPTEEAQELQRRARSLRRFATMIEGAQLGSLSRLGGDATWYGPTAGAFLQDCRGAERLVDDAVDGLRRAATRLDHEAAGLTAPGVAPGAGR